MCLSIASVSLDIYPIRYAPEELLLKLAKKPQWMAIECILHNMDIQK